MKKSYIKISKFLSYILRHHPEKFGIVLDAEGFADLHTILTVINERYQDDEIKQQTIEDLITQSDKRRFEIDKDKIRAFYGHSIDDKINMKEADPLPQKLYHGTNKNAYEIIKKEGLKRKGRQYVHLSDTIKTAYIVGKRRTKEPIILEIDTFLAKKAGIIFYHSGDMYLADFIPSDCIFLTN
jgi:putative RNA 2'-phosphotransferase